MKASILLILYGCTEIVSNRYDSIEATINTVGIYSRSLVDALHTHAISGIPIVTTKGDSGSPSHGVPKIL